MTIKFLIPNIITKYISSSFLAHKQRMMIRLFPVKALCPAESEPGLIRLSGYVHIIIPKLECEHCYINSYLLNECWMLAQVFLSEIFSLWVTKVGVVIKSLCVANFK